MAGETRLSGTGSRLGNARPRRLGRPRVLTAAALSLAAAALLAGCEEELALPDYPDATVLPAPAPDYPRPAVPDAIAPLGRGINIGNALEAPREGEWGITIQPYYFDRIREAGFHTIRVPIRWSAHAQAAWPYRIDEAFFERIDWVIESTLRRGMNAVINVHHYDELFEDPAGHAERFLSIWKQIALRYRNEPGSLYFEALNEPHGRLTATAWNRLYPAVVAVIRETNPDRTVIIDGPDWSGARSLVRLRLPPDPTNLVATFHFYEPFTFTHQGAEWVDGSDAWTGTRWAGSVTDERYLTRQLDEVTRWADRHGIPLWMGEFGSHRANTVREDRLRWTGFVIGEAERRGIAWAYWEFGSHFAVFDRLKGEWDEELLAAMMP